MIEQERIRISGSPHIFSSLFTARVMWLVVIALLPATLWGIYQFGWPAASTILISIVAACATEFLLTRGWRPGKFTIGDGSAFLTGLLVGLNMPAGVPFFVSVVASFFAIFVAKWSFGGLGTNWINPALAGRVFVFFSWTSHMTRWMVPRLGPSPAPDALTTATPLGIVKSSLTLSQGSVGAGPMDLLSHSSTPTDYLHLFLGLTPGSIGEISALCLLVGALLLLSTQIITWHIPFSYLTSFALLVWIFGGLPFQQGFFTGDVLFHLLSGGLMLGAFFMATDLVTSPLTPGGMLFFGVGCGFLTFLIRFFGSLPEAVSLSIILMNMFVPLINRCRVLLPQGRTR